MTGTATAVLCVLSGSAGCVLTCLVAACKIRSGLHRERQLETLLDMYSDALDQVRQRGKECDGQTDQEGAYDEEETTIVPG